MIGGKEVGLDETQLSARFYCDKDLIPRQAIFGEAIDVVVSHFYCAIVKEKKLTKVFKYVTDSRSSSRFYRSMIKEITHRNR